MEKLGKYFQAAEIRKLFLEYFEGLGHEIVSSSSLIPHGDPTLLFTNAGMVQFKEVFLGLEKRNYSRAVTSQKCVRAGGKHIALDNVGFTGRLHTFFEMLGNFSFGDYFKQDAIEYAWDFLKDVLQLPKSRLWITVFKEDDEAANLWRKISGIPQSRIIKMDEKDNFWAMGDIGPCGPCSEIIIDRGEAASCGSDCVLGKCDCDRWLEIWNLVFMQYLRDEQGCLLALPKPSIDTGMGLERIASVLQGVSTNFGIDLFVPIIEKVGYITKRKIKEQNDVFASRVIADHMRACTFLVGDGVHPSNEGRGYVMRRIIRRAIRFGRMLGIKRPFLARLVPTVVDTMKDGYPELLHKTTFIQEIVEKEELSFLKTLEDGQSRAVQMIDAVKRKGSNILSGKDAFLLYDTFGFPIDLTKDIAREQGIKVNEKEFGFALEEQRQRSRKARKIMMGDELEIYGLINEVEPTIFSGYKALENVAEVVAIISGESRETEVEPGSHAIIALNKTPFYATSGGQENDKGILLSSDGREILGRITQVSKTQHGVILHSFEASPGSSGIVIGQSLLARVDSDRRDGLTKHHTATHLLHAALKTILGDAVQQAGSLVEQHYLRFDFNYGEGLSANEIKDVQVLVNQMIMQDLPVIPYETTLENARRKGAIALFDERYGDVVRVVEIPGVSSELCGGTHVSRTGQIGSFIIESESSVAAGIRRIEAITGFSAIDKIFETMQNLKHITNSLGSTESDALKKISELQNRIKILEREIGILKGEKNQSLAMKIMMDESAVVQVGNNKIVASRQDDMSVDELRNLGDLLKGHGASVVILGSGKGPRGYLAVMVNQDKALSVDAVVIARKGAQLLDGSGGGRKYFAQAGGKNYLQIDKALETAVSEARRALSLGS